MAVVLNHKKIEKDPEIMTKFKPFITLHEEFAWSILSHILTEYGEIFVFLRIYYECGTGKE